MKQFFRNILLILSPFIFIILINETSRLLMIDHAYQYQNIKTINSNKYDKNICSWACHNTTSNHCQKYHVKYLKPLHKITDIPYYAVIEGLKQTGSYVYGNIVFLVLIFPCTILIFFIKILKIQDQIRKHSKKQ